MKFALALVVLLAAVCSAFSSDSYGPANSYPQDNTIKIHHVYYKNDGYGKDGYGNDGYGKGTLVDGGYSTANFVLRTKGGYSFGGLGNAGVHGGHGSGGYGNAGHGGYGH
ncbi:glycine-rich protein 3-like [Macrobrachium rosenbergii]|uniref:glycine-rich protein 3-like n=1 Tax=Macrobrachium rosenbergii TaxID=79674 RepID=UPI0034D63317